MVVIPLAKFGFSFHSSHPLPLKNRKGQESMKPILFNGSSSLLFFSQTTNLSWCWALEIGFSAKNKKLHWVFLRKERGVSFIYLFFFFWIHAKAGVWTLEGGRYYKWETRCKKRAKQLSIRLDWIKHPTRPSRAKSSRPDSGRVQVRVRVLKPCFHWGFSLLDCD